MGGLVMPMVTAMSMAANLITWRPARRTFTSGAVAEGLSQRGNDVGSHGGPSR